MPAYGRGNDCKIEYTLFCSTSTVNEIPVLCRFGKAENQATLFCRVVKNIGHPRVAGVVIEELLPASLRLQEATERRKVPVPPRELARTRESYRKRHLARSAGLSRHEKTPAGGCAVRTGVVMEELTAHNAGYASIDATR
jgi:hypothetical protein